MAPSTMREIFQEGTASLLSNRAAKPGPGGVGGWQENRPKKDGSKRDVKDLLSLIRSRRAAAVSQNSKYRINGTMI